MSGDSEKDPGAPGQAPPQRRSRLRDRIDRAKLSLATRIALFVIGWSLVLVGIAGLALPGIQGILTILVGAGVLSVASETVYRLLRRLLHRWPPVWERIERFRDKIADKLSRKH